MLNHDVSRSVQFVRNGVTIRFAFDRRSLESLPSNNKAYRDTEEEKINLPLIYGKVIYFYGKIFIYVDMDNENSERNK